MVLRTRSLVGPEISRAPHTVRGRVVHPGARFLALRPQGQRREPRARDAPEGPARERRAGPPACEPDVLLNEYAKRWLGNREAQGIDPGTTVRQEIDLRRHILPRFGTTKVREIHRPAVKAFLLSKLGEDSAQGIREGGAKRKHKRLARGSVRSILHTLSGILSEAVEDRLIAANPVRGLWRTLSKGAKRTEERVKVKALDPRQAAAFLASAEQHARDHFPYFCTLMLSGLRSSEGLAVTADRIDLRGRTLLVDRQIGQHGGLKATKTGEERSVDLSAHLAGALGPWLFYPELGEKPTRKDAQRVYKNALRAMRRSLEAAGLPTHHGLHALRHTYGSGLVSRGVSPAYVQAQMGHASIQQTVDTYGSWFPPRVPGAVDALAAALAGGRGHQMDTFEGLEAAKAL